MATNPPRTGSNGAPPSAADTKNLTDAINKLTQTLGQNDSTMKDLSKKETDLSKTMKAVGEFTEDFTDSLIKQDLALGLAVKGLTGAGKGIGNLLGFGKKKDGRPGAGAGGGDVPVGTERMGADGYIYVFKGKQWVLKAGQKDKTTGKKLGNRIAPKAVAAGLFGKVGRPTTGASASPASPAGVTSTPDTGGMGSMLTPDYDTSAKAGFGIAAVGAGIAGFIAALALGGAAVNAVGGASGIKDMLSAVGEGLSTFNTQSLVGFGSLLAAGAIFGAVAGPSGAATKGIGAGIGMTMIGLGIGGFFAALSLGAAAAAEMGGPSAVKDMLTSLGEGLGSFNTQSLVAFGGMLGAGALFGAVPGLGALAAGTAALGMTAIGLGIGGFFTGLATGGAAVKQLGGGAVIKDMIVGLGEGLASFNGVNGGNLLKAGTGITALAVGLGALAVEDTIGKIMDFFTGGSDEESTLTKVAISLKSFEEINGENLKNTGDGILSLSQGLLALATMPPIDAKNMQNIAGSLKVFEGVNLPTGGGGANITPASQTTTGAAAPSLAAGGKPSDLSGSKLIEAQSNMTATRTGMSPEQFDIFRKSIASIESSGGNYGIMGGSSGKYAGAYQMGPDAMTDAAKALGIKTPTREEFLNNPQLQEQMFDAYTAMNDKTLARLSPQYKSMAPEQKAQVLAYAHNQGAGGALNYMKTGIAGSDAFGTSGTKYSQLVAANLAGENLNAASTAVESAQMSPTVVVAPVAAGGAQQQAPKAQAAAPAISSGRPTYASVAGANYRGFQVSDITA